MKRYLSVLQKQNNRVYDSRLMDDSTVGENVKEAVTILSVEEQMEEFMFLGLRMMEGVSKQEFADSFGKDLDEVYGSALQKWIQMKMMSLHGNMISLTDAGIDVSNTVLSSFVLG